MFAELGSLTHPSILHSQKIPSKGAKFGQTAKSKTTYQVWEMPSLAPEASQILAT